MDAVFKTPYLLRKYKQAKADRAKTLTIPEKSIIVSARAKLREKMTRKP